MTMIIHKTKLPYIDLDKSSFIYENDYILIQDEYISDVLKCMNVVEIVDGNFYDICDLSCFKDYPAVLEYYALKSARNAYYYAMFVLKGIFELGENIIATDAEYSYCYARDVIEGGFELGEHAILNSEYAELYREQFLCQ